MSGRDAYHESEIAKLARVPEGWSRTGWLQRLRGMAEVTLDVSRGEVFRLAAERLEREIPELPND